MAEIKKGGQQQVLTRMWKIWDPLLVGMKGCASALEKSLALTQIVAI